MSKTKENTIGGIIEEFFNKSRLPREVVPNLDQIDEAVRNGVFCVDYLASYCGKPAKVVLYHGDGSLNDQGIFKGPLLSSPVRKEFDFKLIPGRNNSELGDLALVASTDNPLYTICYFIK